MSNSGRVAFETLGCKLNFSESSALANGLQEAGYARVTTDEGAGRGRGQYVFRLPTTPMPNAATLCGAPRRPTRTPPWSSSAATPNSSPRRLPALTVSTWCWGHRTNSTWPSTSTSAPRFGCEAEQLRVKRWCSRGEIREVTAFHPAVSSGDRTRSFLKVQDGCDYFCAFCTIPLARGRSRSADMASTVAEARKAVAAGAREIVLTGVNIGDFGKAHGEDLLGVVSGPWSPILLCLLWRVSASVPSSRICSQRRSSTLWRSPSASSRIFTSRCRVACDRNLGVHAPPVPHRFIP